MWFFEMGLLKLQVDVLRMDKLLIGYLACIWYRQFVIVELNLLVGWLVECLFPCLRSDIISRLVVHDPVEKAI